MPPSADQWGPRQLATALGTSATLVDRARDMGLIQPPDNAGRWWSAAAVDEIRVRWPEIMAALEASRDLGAVRCAELLARKTGLPVRARDVEELAKRGMLRATRLYRNRPLYLLTDIDALAGDALARAHLAEIVGARQRSAISFGSSPIKDLATAVELRR